MFLKGVLKIFTKFTVRRMWWSFLSNKVGRLQIYFKETPAHVFSYEFSEIFEKTFCTKHLWATASVCNVQPVIHILLWKLCRKLSFWPTLLASNNANFWKQPPEVFPFFCCFVNREFSWKKNIEKNKGVLQKKVFLKISQY